MEELVSIITPMFNSEKYILATIESVINQEYKNWELLIVDDCSTDNSREIVEIYARKESRITLIRQKINQGTASARNEALKVAKGRFIAFLDSDDMWKPDKLSRQIKFMIEKDLAFTYSAFEKVNDRGESLNIIIKVPLKVDYERLLKSNVIQCSTVVIDREKIGNIKMKKIRYEDYSTWLNILKKGKCAYGINKNLLMYRVSNNSYSSNKIKAISWAWNIYRKDQKLGVLKSIYSMANFILLNVLKYTRITNILYNKSED